MFVLTAIKLEQNSDGFSDKGIRIEITRPTDNVTFTAQVLVRQTCEAKKTDITDDLLISLCEQLTVVFNSPIPMDDPEKPQIVTLNPTDEGGDSKIILPGITPNEDK